MKQEERERGGGGERERERERERKVGGGKERDGGREGEREREKKGGGGRERRGEGGKERERERERERCVSEWVSDWLRVEQMKRWQIQQSCYHGYHQWLLSWLATTGSGWLGLSVPPRANSFFKKKKKENVHLEWMCPKGKDKLEFFLLYK